MNFKENLYKMNEERIERFKTQDPECDHFDVVFEIDGKKLYANKYALLSVSTTFKSMVADRWTKPNEPIPIHGYTFEDFKEFLTFIYSGDCSLTDDNIVAMIDIAEFYNVPVFKEICEEYFTKMELNLDNIFQMLEIGNKYSLPKINKCVYDFICSNLLVVTKSEKFKNIKRSFLKEIVLSNEGLSNQEEMFEAVFKWAENQATEKQKIQQNSNLNDEIKKELSEFLPFFKFREMKNAFFIKFIVKRTSLIFSDDELSDILWSRIKKSVVKVIDENGKIMKGELQCDEADNVIEVIQSLKNETCKFFGYFFWRTQQSKPSTPSKLTKNDNFEWYIVYDYEGDLAIKQRNALDNRDYLLAEMVAENGFKRSTICKIEIFYCCDL